MKASPAYPDSHKEAEGKWRTLREIEDLLYLEADLLDGWKLDEWLDLFVEEARYFVPMARNVPFGELSRAYTRPDDEVAWFHEDKSRLRDRVSQLKTGVHWAEEPLSRISHLVTNIRLVEFDSDSASTTCRFALYRNRLQKETDWYVGKRKDAFTRINGEWKIAQRTVYLDQNVLIPKNLTVFF